MRKVWGILLACLIVVPVFADWQGDYDAWKALGQDVKYAGKNWGKIKVIARTGTKVQSDVIVADMTIVLKDVDAKLGDKEMSADLLFFARARKAALSGNKVDAEAQLVEINKTATVNELASSTLDMPIYAKIYFYKAVWETEIYTEAEKISQLNNLVDMADAIEAPNWIPRTYKLIANFIFHQKKRQKGNKQHIRSVAVAFAERVSDRADVLYSQKILKMISRARLEDEITENDYKALLRKIYKASIYRWKFGDLSDEEKAEMKAALEVILTVIKTLENI